MTSIIALPNEHDIAAIVDNIIYSLTQAIIYNDRSTLNDVLLSIPIFRFNNELIYKLVALVTIVCYEHNKDKRLTQIMKFIEDKRNLIDIANINSNVIFMFNNIYIDDRYIKFIWKASYESYTTVLQSFLFYPLSLNTELIIKRLKMIAPQKYNYKDAYESFLRFVDLTHTSYGTDYNYRVGDFIIDEYRKHTPFASVPYWATEDLKPESILTYDLNNITKEEADLYYGPLNPPIEIPVTDDKNWELEYRMLVPVNKDWFVGYCENLLCLKRISKRNYAVRRRLLNGGWDGCYCSYDHIININNIIQAKYVAYDLDMKIQDIIYNEKY